MPARVRVPRRHRDGAASPWRQSICPYCGTGCGVQIRARDGQVAEVRGDKTHPVNQGQLCAKGALLTGAIHTEDRLLQPMLRSDGELRPTGWDAAITAATDAIGQAIRDHGPDAVMLYGSGQLLTEDYYLFGKLAKGYLGTNNQDTNSRLCMASAVVAYTLALGADAPPIAYADIEAANTFLILGANPEACHPILFNRIKARKRAAPDQVRVIVVDPRRTQTAELADLHLQPRPGTDVALLNALLYEAHLRGALDTDFIRDHTTGWDDLADQLRAYPAERAMEITGIPAQDIITAAKIYAENGPALSLWAMGANQSVHGVDKNLGILNLALATGNIGKPGAGPFSLTGQPNAMGGREAGGLAAALPGHRRVDSAEDRVAVEAAWGLSAGTIRPEPGLTAIEMIPALESGRIKVIWIAGTNPVASLPNSERVAAALRQADCVIVQDPYHPTETTRLADVLLPAAQWSERGGTMTNSERRICLLEAAGEPPGAALPDWEIICRIATALGHGDAFTYDSPEEIFDEYRMLTAGQDLDITGLDYERLAANPGGLQWPVPARATTGRPRLFTDHRFATPDGRARFQVVDYAQPIDPSDADYPFVLTTGRVKDQWHTRTRTGKVPKLNRRDPAPFVEVHPLDAGAIGIKDGDPVRVSSPGQSFTLPARVTPTIQPGVLFAPFHWGAEWDAEGVVNRVTSERYDPRSKEPDLKFVAVRLEPASPQGERPTRRVLAAAHGG